VGKCKVSESPWGCFESSWFVIAGASTFYLLCSTPLANF
jgi:hypothetical protein